MGSIGKLTAAIASGTVDTTVALANINFDFSLYRIEAQKEFHGVGTVLSSTRRKEAESGRAHITARKLGALFEPLLPSTPHLVKAYGLRASEISSSAIRNQELSSYGVFASQIGADGTSIWAAATSSHGAIRLHLLACILARMWDGPEATSIWVEIVEGRKLEIAKQFEESNIGDLAAHLAAQQELTRIQLAEWDASARAWLRVADAVKIKQQKQLEVIIGNLNMNVNSKPAVYGSVMQAWKVALEGMECLVSGMPQKMQTGEILLGLSAWHLFPDMIYLDSSTINITQLDPLVHRGGILTIGLQILNDTHTTGVSWSLPLAHLRHYGAPVLTSRSIVEDGSRSRLSFHELLQAILGCIFGGWGKDGSDPEAAAKFIIQINECFVDALVKTFGARELVNYRQSWLSILSATAEKFLNSDGLERQINVRLINLGKKRLEFLGMPTKPLFGLSDSGLCFRLLKDTEHKIGFLRELASKAELEREDIFIRYCRPGPSDPGEYWDLVEYTTAIPYVRSAMKRTSWQHEKPTSAHIRWIHRGIPEDYLVNKLFVYTHKVCQSFGKTKNARLGKEFPNRVLEFSKSGEEIHLIEDEKFEEFITPNEVDIKVSWQRSLSVPKSLNVADYDLATPLYKYLWGEVSTAALFIRCAKATPKDQYADEHIQSNAKTSWRGPKSNHPTLEELDTILQHINLPEIQIFWNNGRFDNIQLIQEVLQATASLGRTYIISLRAIASMAKIYKLASDATVNVQVLQEKLYKVRWVPDNDFENISTSFGKPPFIATRNVHNPDVYISDSELMTIPSGFSLLPNFRVSDYLLDLLGPYGLSRMQSFACMIMLESGNLNLSPDQFRNVMAMSAGDSIFVASGLLCDPSERPENGEIQRIMGNIGRPGIALLVPPIAPEIQKPNLDNWNLINHAKFDGNLHDCFQDTSLHLSFTGASLPLGIENTGRQDVEVYLLESLVSLHERGTWVADLDILKALESPGLTRIYTSCDHEPSKIYSKSLHRDQLTSLQSWIEFLERPEFRSIVCMHENWQARLATTAISIAQSHNVIILPCDVCWGCVDTAIRELRPGTHFTIIA